MKELAVLSLFALLLVILYLCGCYLNPLIKDCFADVNIAPLLPLVTVVYLPYVIRRLSPHLAEFALAAKPSFTAERLIVPLRIEFDGSTTQPLTIEEIISPRNTSVFLQLPSGTNEIGLPTVPEGMQFSLGPQQPMIRLNLILHFSTPPDPNQLPFPRRIWVRKKFVRVGLKARIGVVRRSKTWYIPMEASS